MAAPTVRSSTAQAAGAGTSCVFTAPAGLANDDILIVFFYKENSAAVTAPTGFTNYLNLNVPTDGSVTYNHYAYWKRAASESGSYTFSWTGSVWRNGACLAVQGAITSGDPADVTPTSAEAHNTPPASSPMSVPDVSLTTVSADTLLLYSGAMRVGGAWTMPSGWDAEVYDGGDDITVDRKAQAATGGTGATHATVVWTPGGAGVGRSSLLLALKPPVAATKAPPPYQRRWRYLPRQRVA